MALVIIHFLTCIRESRESLLDGNQFSFNISDLAGLIDVKSNTLAGLACNETLKKVIIGVYLKSS